MPATLEAGLEAKVKICSAEDLCARCHHPRRKHGKAMGLDQDDCHEVVDDGFCECEGFQEAARGAGR